MGWAGHIAGIRKTRSAYSILFGKPERKRPLRAAKLRSEDNIKMDVK
jgi:hypothetical protein